MTHPGVKGLSTHHPGEAQTSARVRTASEAHRGSPAPPTTASTSEQPPLARHLLYRGKWIVPWAVLVRLKLIQVSTIVAGFLPLGLLLHQGSLDPLQVAACGGLIMGCAGVSYTMAYYSGRYVMELELLRDGAGVCITVLDFWGRRLDRHVAMQDVLPPFEDRHPQEVAEMCAQPLLPLNVYGDRQYLLTIPYGDVRDRSNLMALLDGSLQRQGS